VRPAGLDRDKTANFKFSVGGAGARLGIHPESANVVFGLLLLLRGGITPLTVCRLAADKALARVRRRQMLELIAWKRRRAEMKLAFNRPN